MCFTRHNNTYGYKRHIFANDLKSTEPLQFQPSNIPGTNRLISSRYTWWNFLGKNLYEQFHQVPTFTFFALAFLFLFATGATNIFSLITPLAVCMTITMVKDAVYDIFRHREDRKVNNRIFMVLKFDITRRCLYWSEKRSSSLRVGEIIRCVSTQEIPCDIILLASSDSKREVKITTANLDGEVAVRTQYALAKTQAVYGEIAHRYPREIKYSDVRQFNSLITEVEYEVPNADLHSFEGYWISTSSDNSKVYTKNPILVDNILFRGTNLETTEFVLGLVIYTGDDTKLSRNSRKSTRKYSSREKRLNLVFALFFITSLVLCVLFAISAKVWNAYHVTFPWFLLFTNDSRFAYVKMVFSFAFIINQLIPISLLVTIEFQMLMNSYLISNDPNLFDANQRVSASANSVYAADELGQVEFLFSDKTGTLTQNDMLLRVCNLVPQDLAIFLENDKVYQQMEHTKHVSGNEEGTTNRHFSSTAISCFNPMCCEEFPPHFLQLVTCAVLCHTVEVKQHHNPELGPAFVYQATSPDEKAFVEAAAKLGSVLTSTNSDPECESARRLVVQRHTGSANAVINNNRSDLVNTEEFIVDAVLEFDHSRKRMTVMVRYPDGTCHIHSKGAECSMLEPKLCSGSSKELQKIALERANELALSGLRTLVFTTRQVDPKEYHQLLEERRIALSQFGEARRQALQRSTMRIESGLELLAVTGVEDKLQPGVKECLENLRLAGIKVWVLTGDKEETAVTVSQLAGHFQESMKILRITGCADFTSVAEAVFKHLRDLEPMHGEGRFNQTKFWNPFVKNLPEFCDNRKDSSSALEEIDQVMYAGTQPGGASDYGQRKNTKLINIREIARKIQRIRQRILQHRRETKRVAICRRKGRGKFGASSEPIGLVIDGASLQHALHPSLRIAFLDLCMNVTTVLCCRMSPLQKASIVELVHVGLGEVTHGSRPITAAIGDGGNDVSMILQANVGIGIYGKEGREAARAADFVLPQFSYIQRLLLVHGHWAYHRISNTMLLFYYKCVSFTTTNILLAFYSGYSANAWYSSAVFALYNATLTSVNYLLFGMFERHLTDEELLHNPKLYRTISHNANLSFGRILLFILDGIWHGTVIFYGVYFFLAGGESFASGVFFTHEQAHGNFFDFTLCGGSAMVYVVVSAHLRLLIQSRDYNAIVLLGLLVTLVFNISLFMAIQFKVSPSSLDYLTYIKLALSPAFWMGLPITMFVANFPALIWRVKSDSFWESHTQTGRTRYEESVHMNLKAMSEAGEINANEQEKQKYQNKDIIPSDIPPLGASEHAAYIEDQKVQTIFINSTTA